MRELTITCQQLCYLIIIHIILMSISDLYFNCIWDWDKLYVSTTLDIQLHCEFYLPFYAESNAEYLSRILEFNF